MKSASRGSGRLLFGQGYFYFRDWIRRDLEFVVFEGLGFGDF